jgi:hypothetical protein
MATYYTCYGYIQIDKNELASGSQVVPFTGLTNSLTGSINVK